MCKDVRAVPVPCRRGNCHLVDCSRACVYWEFLSDFKAWVQERKAKRRNRRPWEWVATK